MAASSTQKIYGIDDGNTQVGPDFRLAGSSSSGALGYSGGYTPGDQRAAGYPGAARFVVTPTDRDGFDIQGVSTGTNDGYDTYRDLPPPTGVQQTIEIAHHQGSMAYGLEDMQQPASNFDWTLRVPSQGVARNLSYGEGVATFNPVGQAIRGAVDHVSAAAVSAWNMKMHPLDTLGGIVRHYGDAYQADRLGDTILNDIGNQVHGALNSTPVGLINALYRKDETGGMARVGSAGVDSALWVTGMAGATRSNSITAIEAGGKISGAGHSFWTTQTEFDGIKVFQRNDIFDPNLVTTWREGGKVVSGSNLERMATGRAPIGTDGKSVNLHHMLQSNDSAIAEMTQTFHQQNSKIIHINPNTIPSGIDRSAFDMWRENYWTNRAAIYGPQ